ncbi:tyrosine-type recombinase/integrase [Sinorhizobium medicae]|nr:tyrosine-type recombinase/integrase [Sinorhizobium medicae]MDX0872475.1 tyrosine-type recombinase/integrase [Sinorhizobium medicae]
MPVTTPCFPRTFFIFSESIMNQTVNVSITTATRRRTLSSGTIASYPQYYCEYRDPVSGKRRRRAFNRKKDAEAFRNALLVKVAEGSYVDERTAPTVSKAIDHWLADKEGKVKASTLMGYKVVVNGALRGPLLVGTRQERADYTESGVPPKGARFIKLLGDVKLTELTTAMIRVWHKTIVEQCGNYTANRAKSHLKSILALAEEDFSTRAPTMPTGLTRNRHKPKKAIMTTDNIMALIVAAKADAEHGIYYAFPFLTGTRPSEQLGLLWSEVDFDKNLIRIRRIQERDGSLAEMTKTEAGTRDIPMGATLREMLLEWRLRCPRKGKELYRVFPGPGRVQEWPKLRVGGGGPLLYQNFRKRYWKPAFEKLALPYVTPHSARHSFISTLQAQGIEIGLVAQIAGHANPTVTLGHYTQAVRGGAAALDALERAYIASSHATERTSI